MNRFVPSSASVALLVGILMVPLSTFAQDKKDLVKASLVSDTSSVVAGRPFTVGIVMKLKPRWHVYWKNPGDAGQAPEVEWNLPEGWTASELEFPLPHKFTLPGNIVSYGYTTEVMYKATITPPAQVSETEIKLAPKVSWLVCEAVCIPGSADLELKLPVSANATPANAEVFARWSVEYPFDQAIQTNGVITGLKTTAVQTSGGGYQVSSEVVFGKEYPAAAEIYPPFSEEFEVSLATFEQNKQKMMISYTLKPLSGEKVKPGKYVALLTYDMPNGERRGMNLPFTIIDADKPKP